MCMRVGHLLESSVCQKEKIMWKIAVAFIIFAALISANLNAVNVRFDQEADPKLRMNKLKNEVSASNMKLWYNQPAKKVVIAKPVVKSPAPAKKAAAKTVAVKKAPVKATLKAPVKTAAKAPVKVMVKAAPKAAVKTAAKTSAKKTVAAVPVAKKPEKSVAPKKLVKSSGTPAAQTILNPQAAWPFPTAGKP